MKRTRGTTMAISGAITFVLLVGIVQVLGPAIKGVNEFGVAGAPQKKVQMEALASDGPVDIVFSGTSQMLTSLDPTIVDDAAGTRSYNAALTGATPQIQEEWLLEQVVPTLRPRQVVLGVSHLDLLDESPRLNQVIDNWNAGRANRDGVLADIDRSLSESVELVDRRLSLRDPAEWIRALSRGAKGTDAALPGWSATLTDQGLERIWAEEEYHGDESVREFTREEVVPTYSIGTKQPAALRRLLDGLTEQGIEVVLVIMPLTADQVELHPGGQADIDLGMAALEDLATDAGVEILRYEGGAWPNEIFADPLHLNGKGTDVFSHLVAADLAASADGLLHGGDHTDAGDVAVAEFSES